MKKIALVTGASSGLGMEMVYQIAEVFPSLAEIWVTARRGDVLKRLEAELPGRVRSFPGDITLPETRKAVTDALEAEQAHIMILVNAAGFGKRREQSLILLPSGLSGLIDLVGHLKLRIKISRVHVAGQV